MKFCVPIFKIGFLLVLFGVFYSCKSGKNINKVIYLNDLNDSSVYYGDAKFFEPIIQPGDRLAISVGALNPEAAIPYNINPLSAASTAGSGGAQGGGGYYVESDGNINFPQLGVIKVSGLTRRELSNKMTGILSKYVVEPVVTVQFSNFKITMLGELNRPGAINIPDGKVNIIEAIGLGGDLTIYGRRDNILVIREKNGKRQAERMNLNSTKIFKSDYFNLEQNDIVYVEPIKEKVSSISDQILFRNISIITSVASLTTTLFVLIINLIK